MGSGNFQSGCLDRLEENIDQAGYSHSAARLLTALWFENENYAKLAQSSISRPDIFSNPILLPRVALAQVIVQDDLDGYLPDRSLSSNQFFILSERLRKLGRSEGARVSLEIALKIDNGWESALDRSLAAFWVGRARQNDQQWDMARGAYQLALPGFLKEASPVGMEYASYTYVRLATIAQIQNDYQLAANYYEMSIRIGPQWGGFLQYVDFLMAEGKPGSEIYSTLLQLCNGELQNDPYIWSGAILALREKGFLGYARRILDVVPTVLIDDPEIMAQQGLLEEKQGYYDTAYNIYLSLYQQAKLNGGVSEIAEWAAHLGNVLLLQDRPEQAQGYLEEAVLTDPTVYWYWYALGDTFQKMGRTEDARSAYQQALTLNPEYLPAKQALEEIGIP